MPPIALVVAQTMIRKCGRGLPTPTKRSAGPGPVDRLQRRLPKGSIPMSGSPFVWIDPPRRVLKLDGR